ncbi:MAG: UDP-N-acetylglucosamine 2-epimerase (non-hydrolyzing) [Cyanobacteria bacterium]|nr:UDP-N-acetylglucosamine 2-epimerase (non-hydrolyzing) [Cyanobacteriota bacterium]
MKILTILGTRPEIIRLAQVIEILDRHASSHVLVHTGQNYDARLSDQFFEELHVRRPDEHMAIRESGMAVQIGRILEASEALFRKHRPDRLLILGDTNSGLSAIIARRLGIPVYHMEAGNRCFDDRVPEEVNRRVIDHCSTVLMPYTERSRANLLAEGIDGARIFVTGNPIKDVMDAHGDRVKASRALAELQLTPRGYFLATFHRAENVDHEGRLRSLLDAFAQLHARHGKPIVCSLHPRTKAKIEAFGLSVGDGIRFSPPFGFADFLSLEGQAFCTLSDSGTVQEEACIMGVPNVTIRDVTERPETIECGSNILAGATADRILPAVALATQSGRKWTPPPEYLQTGVAATVCRIVLGHRQPDAAEIEWQERARS